MKKLDTKEAGVFKIAAVLDARRRNTVNKSLYTDNQIRRAVSVRDLLDTAFAYHQLYINYRQRFISITASGVRPRGPETRGILKMFQASGYELVETPQAVIVRLDKQLV
jgi:hypothetical protein